MNSMFIDGRNVELEKLLGRITLSDTAGKLAEQSKSPLALLDNLIAQQLWVDAVTVMANLLTKRQAVWWACVCLDTLAYPLNELEAKAMMVVKDWIKDNQEDKRRLTWTMSEKAGLQTAAGCIALAAFWSEGSMAPADAPAIFPAEHLCYHVVVASIMLGMTKASEKVDILYSQLIELGRAIASKQL